MSHLPQIGRRGLLLGLAAMATAGQSRLAVAAQAPPGEARLVVVLLRGAMDGLAAVPAYGDPDFAAIRGPLALPGPGEDNGILDLGGFHGLHPKLAALHRFYQANEAIVLQAVAGPYRIRSHFIAQDLLESGAEQRMSSGWLNRALEAIAPGPDAAARPGLAVGLDMPLLLRGLAPVGMYAPPRPQRPEADLYMRLAELNHDDPMLGAAVAEGMRGRGYAGGVFGNTPQRNGFVALAGAAGKLLADKHGPRIAALELGGWDTHAGQAQRMDGPLGALDAGIAALRGQLGDAWRRTAVLVMTEFGRTPRINGSGGTDHGTAGAAFLVGGAVAGGRVITDWPGLTPGKLFEKRDLMPTIDTRAVAKGLLADHLGLPDSALAAAFPDSTGVPPMRGLVREA